MTATNDYISAGITALFGQSPIKLSIANQYFSTYSANTATLISKLDGLCKCSFTAQATLYNVIASPDVSATINTAINNAGGQAPLVSGNCGKIGTLGSFYSCTSKSDTNPTLIATGSELCADRYLAQQACANWAVTQLGECYANKIYGSYSSSGGCFKVYSCDDGPGAALAYCTNALDYKTLLYPSDFYIE